MAARENQGLQIALIIFVMLTIVLIVTTYMFFSNFQLERDKGKALVTENGKLTKDASDARMDSEECKKTIGADSKDNQDAIKAKARKDFDTYGKSIPEANQNYRYLVEQLGTELKNANTRIAEITANETKLSDKIKSDEADKRKEMEIYTQTVAATADDLVGVRKTFATERSALNKGKAELSQKSETNRKKFDELTKKSSGDINKLTEETTKLSSQIKSMNEKNLDTETRNEVADGKIVKVDQRTRLAWIDRGVADGLRRQMTFSVYHAEDSNPLKGKRKGKIEVVRLIEAHLAEVRIVDDDLSDLMISGDPIFSPTWEPGRAEHFALAGKIDIDKDGQNDFQRVRDLISLNGGIIDEEVDENDKKTGQMSINTKYLVLGDAPASEGKVSSYGDIQTEARALGVRIININEFLNYLGFKSEDRTVALGKTAQGRDFKARLPGGVQRVRPTSPSQDLRKKPPTSQRVTH
jgi:hypothetical protein